MIALQSGVTALPPGRYIVAVSGGVDSMALLDMMRQYPSLEVIVAHADHGIRTDTALDSSVVESFCKSHNITFVAKKLHLSATTGENRARDARYSFLRSCRIEYNASAIVTAHHQDDVIETALFNVLRGTYWRGVAPFTQKSDIVRPLLDVTKSQLFAYATLHKVPWREDTTNTDQRYSRNYIRHTVIPALESSNKMWKQDFMRQIRIQRRLRRTIEDELTTLLTSMLFYEADRVVSRRYTWCMLGQPEGYELFQAMCRAIIGGSLVRDLAQAGLLFAKVARPSKVMPLNAAWQLRVTTQQLIVEPR
jgi:tRNA(Ile)-lysidine synthetase-like protein